jgi:4-amino-4-deoxy-L-arabinose transferase-like glycosyltransferase
VVFAVLFFVNLGRTGFLGPDEPRYASIGRDMARTGDWVTPRLDGQPWFEKPPLTYWLTALGHLAHLPDEFAARLPQALLSLGFFFFYFRILRAEFSLGVAVVATSILATSIGWLAFSFVAVTDLPMAATLNMAVLLTVFPRFDPRSPRDRWLHGALAGVLLGLSVLGKGFVPLVLFAPLLFIAAERFAIVAVGMVVAAPWYLLCWGRNGGVFWDELFWKHHVTRFFSPSLDHVQPFWYYIPILMAGIFPWTPLLALIGQEGLFDDVRLKRLGWWLLWGLVFFSAARNKLPGYILPLLPCVVILITVAFSRSPISTYWLAGCVWMAAWLPTAAGVLPKALSLGLSRAMGTYSPGGLLLLVLVSLLIVAVAALWLAIRINGFRATPLLALAIAITIGVLLSTSAPRLDRDVSARAFFETAPARISGACLDHVSRTLEYGLNYYAGHALPACRPDEPANRTRATMQDGKLVLK